jgi:predicted  nucleic acid-binding Zn-ribbon protein
MKATPGQQQVLLKINELELELRRTQKAITELETGVALRVLQNELRASSELMLAAQARYENFEVDIARVMTDLEMVEARIQRDLERLSTSTVPKDIAGVQSELAALESRKSLLETSELELLEARDAAGFEVTEAQSVRADLTARIATLEASVQTELAKLQSTGSIIQEQIRTTRSTVSADLLAAFDRKASRGIPIGRLIERDCGACRIALTSAVFSEVTSAAEDELPTCPNCEAFLVR